MCYNCIIYDTEGICETVFRKNDTIEIINIIQIVQLLECLVRIQYFPYALSNVYKLQ